MRPPVEAASDVLDDYLIAANTPASPIRATPPCITRSAPATPTPAGRLLNWCVIFRSGTEFRFIQPCRRLGLPSKRACEQNCRCDRERDHKLMHQPSPRFANRTQEVFTSSAGKATSCQIICAATRSNFGLLSILYSQPSARHSSGLLFQLQ